MEQMSRDALVNRSLAERDSVPRNGESDGLNLGKGEGVTPPSQL